MPTPVGPAPRDPNDPDLWEEWYEPDEPVTTTGRFGWPARVLAILLVVGLAVLVVMAA